MHFYTPGGCFSRYMNGALFGVEKGGWLVYWEFLSFPMAGWVGIFNHRHSLLLLHRIHRSHRLSTVHDDTSDEGFFFPLGYHFLHIWE